MRGAFRSLSQAKKSRYTMNISYLRHSVIRGVFARILLKFPLLDSARPLRLSPLLVLVILAWIASGNIAIPRGMMGPRPLSCHRTVGHRGKNVFVPPHFGNRKIFVT